MAGDVLDFNPISRITIGTVGPPGKRIFLLQAGHSPSSITLKLEKEQARILASSVLEFLDEINNKYSQPTERDTPLSSDLMLQEPLEPEFVIGQIGLGYDEDQDMIVLVVQELQTDELHQPTTVRFWATRGQMRALSDHTLGVVDQGRPICPLCNTPIDPSGQFCPRSNGHESPGSSPCPTG